MLSIIVSSYKPENFAAFEKNVEETCGEIYEIIKIDNPGKMGIAEAYNLGAEKAKFKNLIFVHDDVEFATEKWGQILLKEYFSLPNVGVIGFAGSTVRYDMCYGYGFNSIFLDRIFVLVNSKKLELHPNKFNKPHPAKVLDGVFLGMKKEVWEKIRFNDKILKGFHFYDIDFTLRASEKFQNYLITNVKLIHFSKGNFGNDWVSEAIRFSKLKNYNFDEITAAEKKMLRKDWYERLRTENISFRNRIRYAAALGVDRFSRRAMQEFLFPKTG